MRRHAIPVLALALVAGCKSKPSSSERAPDTRAPTPSAVGSGSAAPTPSTSTTTPTATTTAVTGEDLLSLASGTMVVQTPDATEGLGAAWYLFDEDPTTGWTAQHDKIAATPLVLELPARVRIDRVFVDAANLELDSRLPEKLVVEISDESATAGFKPLAEAALSLPNVDNVELKVAAPASGRWLRILPSGKHGETDQTQLMELRAYGERLAAVPPIDVTGTYKTSKGWFHLQQTGTVVTGCYEASQKPFLGGIEGRLVKFQFEGGVPAATGPAILTFGERGKIFGGFFASTVDQQHAVLDPITGARSAPKPGPCPTDKAPEDPIATALKRDGRVRLPGINFDSDSDHIRDESKPTLDRVVAILKATPALAVTIAGHTDSTSTPEHNVTLSEKRADAVKSYLVAAGIAADRLDPHGYGQTQPIAPNTSALGRAQNRRVELEKK
jgi:outer membrane protein OmpA-like peptidoglycan-associated protein